MRRVRGCAGSQVRGFTGTVLVLVFASAWEASAQVQMPDPSLIHGKALPAGDLQTGTVTVRVVRESIGNNVVGQLQIVSVPCPSTGR